MSLDLSSPTRSYISPQSPSMSNTELTSPTSLLREPPPYRPPPPASASPLSNVSPLSKQPFDTFHDTADAAQVELRYKLPREYEDREEMERARMCVSPPVPPRRKSQDKLKIDKENLEQTVDGRANVKVNKGLG